MDETEIIYGRNPVVEVANGTRKTKKIWLTDKTAKSIGYLLRTNSKIIEIVSKERIARITGRGDHQGAAAEVELFHYSPFKAITELIAGVVLAADRITDPRNLGAIIRSAAILGAKGIIIPKKNSALITPVVCHTSAGATERIAICCANSLAHSLNILKGKGFTIVGAEVPGPKTISITDFNGKRDKLVLVLGAEGFGLRGKIRALCDHQISIPQKTDFDSLNVSVAASILLWELLKKETGS